MCSNSHIPNLPWKKHWTSGTQNHGVPGGSTATVQLPFGDFLPLCSGTSDVRLIVCCFFPWKIIASNKKNGKTNKNQQEYTAWKLPFHTWKNGWLEDEMSFLDGQFSGASSVSFREGDNGKNHGGNFLLKTRICRETLREFPMSFYPEGYTVGIWRVLPPFASKKEESVETKLSGKLDVGFRVMKMKQSHSSFLKSEEM